MTDTMTPASSAERLRGLLRQQGRTMAWLAEELGTSRPTLYRVLNREPGERSKADQEMLDDAAELLGLDLLTADFFKGRAVTLPRSLFAELRTASSDTKSYTYEIAWKRSWVKEHGAEAVAAAAERAWLAENELAGAR